MNDVSLSFDNTEDAFSYKTTKELQNSRLVFESAHYPWLVNLGTKLIKFSLSLHLPIKFAIKPTIFSQFCGGESIDACDPIARRLQNYGVGAILDYSVEGTKSEKGFTETMKEVMRTIEHANLDPKNPFCVFKMTGIGSMDLMAKMQSGKTLDEKEKEKYRALVERLDTLCKAAFERKVKLLIDAEESWIQDPIDQLVYSMMAKYNKEEALIFNTYQMYRHEMLQRLKQAHARAVETGYFLGAKLVRGAYMEKERERAEENEYVDPIQPTKEATDRDFDLALRFCIANIDNLSVFCGTHNENSTRLLVQLIEDKGLSKGDDRVWFAQLFGMSDNISFILAKNGFNVAKYMPYGPVSAVMPYLFRRAQENTSIAGQTNRELAMVKKELKRRKSL